MPSMSMPANTLARFVLGFLVVTGLALGLSSVAEAQALRRFEEAHKSPSSASSSSSSSSSSRSSSAFPMLIDALFGPMFSSGGGTESAGERSARLLGNYEPAAVVYSGSRASAYVHTHRIGEEGFIEKTGDFQRFGELKVGGFTAASHRVYGHDLALSGWLGFVVAQGSWERFYESRLDRGAVDQLDMFRGHVGVNVLGSMVKSMELYVLGGVSGMNGQESLIPAFDASLQARVYPVRPLALYGSSTVSFFEHGPPLLDARLEAGVSIGRFDFRAGFRALRQESAQSFYGPVASIALRL